MHGGCLLHCLLLTCYDGDLLGHTHMDGVHHKSMTINKQRVSFQSQLGYVPIQKLDVKESFMTFITRHFTKQCFMGVVDVSKTTTPVSMATREF